MERVFKLFKCISRVLLVMVKIALLSALIYYAFFSKDYYAGYKIGIAIALIFPVLFLYWTIDSLITEFLTRKFMSGLFSDFPAGVYFKRIVGGDIAIVDGSRHLIEILHNKTLIKSYGNIWRFLFLLPGYSRASKNIKEEFVSSSDGTFYYLTAREQKEVRAFVEEHTGSANIEEHLGKTLTFEIGKNTDLCLIDESTFAVLKLSDQSEVRLELNWRLGI